MTTFGTWNQIYDYVEYCLGTLAVQNWGKGEELGVGLPTLPRHRKNPSKITLHGENQLNSVLGGNGLHIKSYDSV